MFDKINETELGNEKYTEQSITITYIWLIHLLYVIIMMNAVEQVVNQPQSPVINNTNKKVNSHKTLAIFSFGINIIIIICHYGSAL